MVTPLELWIAAGVVASFLPSKVPWNRPWVDVMPDEPPGLWALGGRPRDETDEKPSDASE